MNLANQVGLVGVSVQGGQVRPVMAAAAQSRQHRVEPGDARKLVGGQPELTAKRPDEVTLAPPDLTCQPLDAHPSVSGHDAAPGPLDLRIEAGQIISASYQQRVQDSCVGGPRSFCREPLGDLVHGRAEHVAEGHHRSRQLLQGHAEQTTCTRRRQLEVQALDRTVSLDDVVGLGQARDEGGGVAAERLTYVDDDRDHSVRVLDPAVLTYRAVDEPDVRPHEVLPQCGVDRQHLSEWAHRRHCGRLADHGKTSCMPRYNRTTR